jgi:hemolysin D
VTVIRIARQSGDMGPELAAFRAIGRGDTDLLLGCVCTVGRDNALESRQKHQRVQKEAERNTIAATISKLEADEPIIRQRVEIRRTLTERELGSKLTYLEILQLLTENHKDTAIQQSRLDEANAALAAAIETRAQAVVEFHRTLFGDLAEAERKAAGLVGDFVRA